LSVPDAIGKVLETQHQNAKARVQQRTDATLRLSSVPPGGVVMTHSVTAPSFTDVIASHQMTSGIAALVLDNICPHCQTEYQNQEGCKVCRCGSACE
jgi:hypothetical protein